MLINRFFVRTKQGLIHYRSCGIQADSQSNGKNNPRPLFMLHPSPASSRFLEPLMTHLAHDRFVIAPDTPGNGDSEPLLNDIPSMIDYAQAMLELAEQLEFDDIDIYGSHTGAHIAIEAALQKPEFVNKIILDGVVLLSDQDRDEYLQKYAPPQQIDQTGSQFHWAWNYMRDQMIFAPHFRKDAEHIRAGGDLSAKTLHLLTLELLKNIETYHLAYHAVFKHNIRNRAQLVNTDTLVLREKGGVLNKYANEIAKLLPNSTLSEVKTEPDQLLTAKSKLISRFLN